MRKPDLEFVGIILTVIIIGAIALGLFFTDDAALMTLQSPLPYPAPQPATPPLDFTLNGTLILAIASAAMSLVLRYLQLFAPQLAARWEDYTNKREFIALVIAPFVVIVVGTLHYAGVVDAGIPAMSWSGVLHLALMWLGSIGALQVTHTFAEATA